MGVRGRNLQGPAGQAEEDADEPHWGTPQMTIRHALRRMLRTLGYDLSLFSPTEHPIARRAHLLKQAGVTVVLDVGANRGQYGQELRELHYKGRIASFEPLAAAFVDLERRASRDGKWQAYNCALGATSEKRALYVAGNSYSSSFLEMLPSHLSAAPASRYVGSEQVEVATLDSMFYSLCSDEDVVYMKIDTQGFEASVLEGAKASMDRLAMIQLEMSLRPLYKGEQLFADWCEAFLHGGYQLVSLSPGFTDARSGELLQVDGVWRRPGWRAPGLGVNTSLRR